MSIAKNFETFLYNKELQETKNLLNCDFKQIDVICECEIHNMTVNFIMSQNDDFNDLILIVKCPNKPTLNKLIDCVKLYIGGHPYDTIPGNFIEILLKHYDLESLYQDDTIMIPIPFSLIIKKSMFFSKMSTNYEKRIYIKFNCDVNACSVKYTKYLHDLSFQNIITQNTNFFTFIEKCNPYFIDNEIKCFPQIFKFFQNEINRKICDVHFTSNLNFNFYSSHIFIVFTDSSNNIIKNKIFSNLDLTLNNNTIISATYESLLDDTSKSYGQHSGHYCLNLENINTHDLFYFKAMPNFSFVDNIKLKINFLPEFVNVGNEIHVGCISYNSFVYYNNVTSLLFVN